MTASIKISDDLKRLIEELQAKILIYQKRKLKQQEIIEKMLNFAAGYIDSIFGIIEDKKSIEDDYAYKVLYKPKKWGISDSSINIDRYLYE
ncbi:MAG: hypothetical protein ACTSPQ_14550 [Candidatus Helarchaeota archaeon]